VNFKQVKNYLESEGIEFTEDLIMGSSVAVYKVEEFGNFFMLNDKMKWREVEPDCGKAYVYSKHEDVTTSLVDEFISRVKGFNATVILSCRKGSVLPTGFQPDCFGMAASIFAPEGCLAVTDGELLSGRSERT